MSDADQRSELISLQRSLLGSVKIAAGAVIAMLLAGVTIAIADHFKLTAVEGAVLELSTVTTKFSEDVRSRNESLIIWRASTDATIQDQRARVGAIEARMSSLESQVRQERAKP